MSRLVLHLGRSKTGSTLVQEFLALNRASLARAGVNVPDSFATDNHAELALAFSRKPGHLARAQAIKGDDDRRRLQERVAHKLRTHVQPGSTWLMTSEHLSSRLRSDEEVRELRAFLGEFFDEVHAIAYVRRPDHLAPSLYAEAVKAGRTKKLNAGFVRRHQHGLDHEGFIRRWSSALGQEFVVARPFVESFKERPTDLVCDLLTAVAHATGLGLDVSPDSWTWPDRPLNRSLSAETTEFLRLVNPHVPDGALTRSQRRTLITELSRRSTGRSVTLTPSARRALVEATLLTGGLDRAGRAPDPLWDEWFDAPPAPVAVTKAPPPRRLVALMAELSAPAGPIRWGGRRVPDWVPDGVLESTRTAVVRVLRR